MDKSTHIPGAPEFYCEAITAEEMLVQATVVFDRVTGEAYDPKARFDELMNKPEIMASLKRLAVR
jgi:hypothetical protein